MKRIILAALVGVLLFAPSFGLAQTSDIASVVKHCVRIVNNISPKGRGMGRYYREFDAYYEPSTQLVHDNAGTVGAQKPLFQFNKCMSEQGLPLYENTKK